MEVNSNKPPHFNKTIRDFNRVDPSNRLGTKGSQNGSQQNLDVIFSFSRESNINTNSREDQYEDTESDIDDGLDLQGW